MKDKLRNYIEACIFPNYFYEEKLPHLWLFSLILPALTGIFAFLCVGLDKYFSGLVGVVSVVETTLIGFAFGICIVFFRAAVIKIVSVFVDTDVGFQELSYAIGSSFGFSCLIGIIGFILRVAFGFYVSGIFLPCAALVQLIPLYNLLIYLNLGGIKKKKIISLAIITAVGVIHLLALKVIL